MFLWRPTSLVRYWNYCTVNFNCGLVVTLVTCGCCFTPSSRKQATCSSSQTKQTNHKKKIKKIPKNIIMKFVLLQLIAAILSTQNTAFTWCRKECNASVILCLTIVMGVLTILLCLRSHTCAERFKPGILAQLQNMEHAGS